MSPKCLGCELNNPPDLNYLKSVTDVFKIANFRGWDNIIRLFYNNAIFKNNLERRRKLIKYFVEHRRSKVILRTLVAINKGNHNSKTICVSMGIQRKHIARVKTYLNQLDMHNMISLSGGKFNLEEKGKNFLNYAKRVPIDVPTTAKESGEL